MRELMREQRTKAVSSCGLDMSAGLVTAVGLGAADVGVASDAVPSFLVASLEGVLAGVTLRAEVKTMVAPGKSSGFGFDSSP
jgi:hypothetical protein